MTEAGGFFEDAEKRAEGSRGIVSFARAEMDKANGRSGAGP